MSLLSLETSKRNNTYCNLVGGRESTLEYLLDNTQNLLGIKARCKNKVTMHNIKPWEFDRCSTIVLGQMNSIEKVCFLWRLILSPPKLLIVISQAPRNSSWERLVLFSSKLLGLDYVNICTSMKNYRSRSYWEKIYINPLDICTRRIEIAGEAHKATSHHGAPLRVSYFGRHDKNKGSDIAIKIFQRLSIDDKFLLRHFSYGERPNFRVKQDNLEIDFANIRSISDSSHVLRDLSCCDLCILPYKNMHGTIDPPLLAIESILLGIPIISTKASEIGDALKSSELIFDTQDELLLFMTRDLVKMAQSEIRSMLDRESVLQRNMLRKYYR